MRAVLAALPPAMPRAHPHRRADRRGAGLPGAAQRAAGGMAAATTPTSTRAGRWCTPRTSTTAETQGIARSGATVAICPTTEANLGDGLFPLRDYLDAGGAWGIGSDSHISVSPVEELRWLEYGQRLVTRHRNIAVRARHRQQRRRDAAARGAWRARAQSTGHAIGTLPRASTPMRRARHRRAAVRRAAQRSDAIDRWIFSGNRNLVRDVHVGGRAGGGRRPAPAARRDRGALSRRRWRRCWR